MTTKRVHKEDIKSELRKRYGTVRAFEQARSLPELSVKDVLRGRASQPTEQAIASELGKPLHVLFPERWQAAKEGDSSLKRDSSRSRRDAHRLSAEAV